MKNDFAILPWEYRGADFAPESHASATLTIAGYAGDFLLKMHDRVIYFKDSKRTPLFAIPYKFASEMSGEELIEAWRTEVERENYGRYFWRPLNHLNSSASTVIACINRADFSGWICDAFHRDWLQTPKHRDGKELNVWKDDIGNATWRAIGRVRDALFDREMPANERHPIKSHWSSGSEVELRRLFAVVMQLYVRRSGADSSRTWTFYASNPAWQGGFLNSFSSAYNVDLRFSSAHPHLLRLLKQHFVWVAMDWAHHNTTPNTPALKESAKKFGEHWRGNYSVYTPTLEITAPLVGSLSQHERLELLLELRDWLEGKVSPRQSANWLSKALD
ncbi:hypothetical protein IAD21_05076 [Abditibacteriota bacterium]|nr:hypothetical protein IAD21_05076 [Abditibacteriota bacterium]